MAGSLDALFEPLRIGNLRTRNRIVSLPHGNSYGRDGEPLPELLPYLQELAAQTAGIVTVGATAIDETTFREPLIRVFDERKLPVFREVAARIHAGGALAICQLGHSGWQAPIWQPGVPPWAPSPEPPLGTGDRLARLEVADLDRVREAYVRSARNALAAGFDGVEVHSAHGYLMQQFLSPHFNRRADAYGGSLENRARLLVEVLSLLRAEAGERLVGIRLGAGDDMAGGLELAEVLEVARMLDAWRLVDYVSLSAPAKAHQYVKDESYPRGGLRESAGALKTAISIPVTVSQRIDTPELAAEILAAGQADLIGLARELVADPAWGAKARLGQTGDIRPCVACLEDCRVGRRQTLVGCSVNPTAYGLVPPLVDAGPPVAARRVVVVGGGPAGCEAALAAASRDCEVVLFERSTTLGGNARLAGQAPYRAAWARYADFLMRQVQQEPRIEVRLGQAADAVAVLEARPDLVVLATGATMSSSLAWADVPSLTSYDLLARAAPPDWRRVAVVDLYGRWDAVNAVELLVGAGVQVLYVTPQERIAHRVPEESRDYVLARLVAADVVCGTGARLSTEGRTAVVEGPFLRRQAAMEALDGIVVSGELAPETASRAWDLGGVSVRRVGDCLAPRGLSLATREGWLVGSILAAPVAA